MTTRSRNSSQSGAPRGWALRGALLAALALGVVLMSCAPNDPFDPDSVENIRPTVGMSVAPPDTGTLPVTSYYNRTFHWHGSDQDGWIVGFDLSIRLEPAVPAPWVTTTRTDTTMTFVTDDNGEAEVTFFIVARDNRGALSDTLELYFPLSNSPPQIFFDRDFEPLTNLQREVPAPGDTLYWNWGYSNFKLVATDADGLDTMDPFYRYTFSDTEPTETYVYTDPLADPETTWVQAPLTYDEYTPNIAMFEITASNLVPGERTLTVSIRDEGGSDARFLYQWDVRAPKSNILYIKDNTSSIGRDCYNQFMNERFGVGNWDTYDFWMGYPDRHAILTDAMRKYEAVLWTDGGSTSDIMFKASEAGGALIGYLTGANPGRLLFISPVATGTTSRVGALFRQQNLGLSAAASPVSSLTLRAGEQALGESGGVPPMTSNVSSARGIGLVPYVASGSPLAENLYRMEYCLRCYNSRDPYDPVVGIRAPTRGVDALARTITIGAQLEYFNRAEVLAALNYLFDVEMGVSAP